VRRAGQSVAQEVLSGSCPRRKVLHAEIPASCALRGEVPQCHRPSAFSSQARRFARKAAPPVSFFYLLPCLARRQPSQPVL